METTWTDDLIADLNAPSPEGKFLRFKDGIRRGGLVLVSITRRERTFDEVAKLEKKTIEEIMDRFTVGGEKLPIVYDIACTDTAADGVEKQFTTQSLALLTMLRERAVDIGDQFALTRYSGGRMWDVVVEAKASERAELPKTDDIPF